MTKFQTSQLFVRLRWLFIMQTFHQRTIYLFLDWSYPDPILMYAIRYWSNISQKTNVRLYQTHLKSLF